MTASTRLTVLAQLTPQQIAEAFWELDAEQQVAFFAHLDDIAGIRLCYQMAAVVSELAEYAPELQAARDAFSTMFAHASEMAATIPEHRAFIAKLGIEYTVCHARNAINKATRS